MNHFNYFSDIESAFVRRRGKNLLLSPVDWALIEEWEQRGIPLKIVLATIDEIFDQLEADPKRAGSVRTLTYCKDAVEARYKTWKESMVGAAEGSGDTAEYEAAADRERAPADFGGRLAELLDSLRSIAERMEGNTRPAVTAAIDGIESLRERDAGDDEIEVVLDRLDGEIDAALIADASDEEIRNLRQAALFELGARSRLMDEDILARTTEKMVKKELRKASGIPSIGVFRL